MNLERLVHLPAIWVRAEKEVLLARVMVLYASIGSGHKKAAEAITASLSSSEGEGAEVILLDVLTLMNPLYRFLVPKGYIWMARNSPAVLGILFRMCDQPVSLYRFSRWIRSFFSTLFSLGFSQVIREFSPQVVVCTHFLPMELLSPSIFKDKEEPVLLISVTDIIPHAFWVNPRVGRYFVASQESAERLLKWGVDPEKILISGIPVHPLFRRDVDVGNAEPEVRRGEKVLNLLVVAGGGGIAPIEELLEAFAGIRLPISITVVTGSNRALFRRLLKIRDHYPAPLVVRGFVREMSHLMEKADLVITKPGGLTTSECLSMGKPMLLFSPIPGQESDNRQILESWGVALFCKSPSMAPFFVSELIANDEELNLMSERARERGRGESSSIICREILFFLKKSRTRSLPATMAERVFSKGRVAFTKWF